MKREDLEKLLGGYATGTLTEAERRALYEAALTDQALFDALAGEEALREVLEDPRCRRQIEQALREPRPGFLGRAAGWMRRPRGWAIAGALAAAAAVVFIAVRPEIQVAQYRKAEAPPVAPERQAFEEPALREQKSPEDKSKAQPAPAPVPNQPPAAARSRRMAEPQPAAPPPAAPAQPVQLAESAAAGVSEDVSKRETSGAAGAPARLFSAGVPPAPQAVALPPIRYEVLVKAPDGSFVPADPRTPVAPGVPVRLVLTANRQGNLAVFDEERNLLFSTSAAAGASYTVDPPPAGRKFTVMLVPGFSARTAATTALREVPQAETQPGSDVTVIDLTRPRN